MPWGFTTLKQKTVTGEVMQAVVPTLSPGRAAAVADLVNKMCPYYKMDDPDILHEFIAQIAHESGGFRLKEENLNYSWPRLRVIFPKYFRTDDEAKQFHRQPQRIANRVYGGRMGNTNLGDGWKFRGAGFIQLTGRDIFTRYGKHKHMTAEEAAVLLRTNDQWAMDSACWVFAVEKNLIQLAIDDKFERITRLINGGMNGFISRLEYYERAKKFLV